jgi:16S rRNA C967 or C1407 C5-methylase (RsmB/RsmF family)
MAAAENDEVVQQAVQQSKGSVLAVPVEEWGVVDSERLREAAGAELTKQGMLCLPDKAGCGPIYLCLLQKQEL